MENWDPKRYECEKRNFIRYRAKWSPLWSQFTLLFSATWAAAWACSALLLWFFGAAHGWARLLPLRYALAFLFAYGFFFLAARVWMTVAQAQPEQRRDYSYIGDLGNASNWDDGCLYVLLLLVAGFVVAGIFLAIGGAPLLLEAAFEAAFAGVVVTRPLKGDLVIGDWKRRLLANTWKPALGTFIVLIALAAFLRARVPQATTFAQAVVVLLN